MYIFHYMILYLCQVVSLRLSCTNIAANSSEVMVYGTAVVIE